MKKILLLFITFISSLFTCWAQTAHLTGKLNGYKGGDVSIIQITDNGKEETPLQLTADGSFTVDVNVSQFGLAYFVTEEPKASTVLIIEPGMKADLQVTFGKKMSFGEETDCLTVVYTGDNKDAFEYENNYDSFENFSKWPWEKMGTVSFADYRKDVEKDIEHSLRQLYLVKNANYRQMKGKQLEGERFSNLADYCSHFVGNSNGVNFALPCDHLLVCDF